jgi:hypothetical protein
MPAPLYNQQPRLKLEINMADLPKWNGDSKGAVDFLLAIDCFVMVGGLVPNHLAQVLSTQFKSGSSIEKWWMSLKPIRRKQCRLMLLGFINTIVNNWLGDAWLRDLSDKYNQQSFRECKQAAESPLDFIMSRVLLGRMTGRVHQTAQGGVDKVQAVMRRAPIDWQTPLVLAQIHTITQLMLGACTHKQALIRSWEVGHALQKSSSALVTKDSVDSWIQAALKKAGQQGRYRSAHVTLGSAPSSDNTSLTLMSGSGFQALNEDYVYNFSKLDAVPAPVRDVLQVLKQNPRPPPAGGYLHPKDDSNKSNTKPLSPCKYCGSHHHWDRCCKHAPPKDMQTCSVKLVQSEEMDPSDEYYNICFKALIKLESILAYELSEAYQAVKAHLEARTAEVARAGLDAYAAPREYDT